MSFAGFPSDKATRDAFLMSAAAASLATSCDFNQIFHRITAAEGFTFESWEEREGNWKKENMTAVLFRHLNEISRLATTTTEMERETTEAGACLVWKENQCKRQDERLTNDEVS